MYTLRQFHTYEQDPTLYFDSLSQVKAYLIRYRPRSQDCKLYITPVEIPLADVVSGKLND